MLTELRTRCRNLRAIQALQAYAADLKQVARGSLFPSLSGSRAFSNYCWILGDFVLLCQLATTCCICCNSCCFCTRN